MQNDLRFAGYFLFTQYSLATFNNCPLKFKKRYLENLKWDSFPDEEVKKRLERGNNFHLLAYRYFMGIDTGLDDSIEGHSELGMWMEALKKSFPVRPDYRYLPEYKLRMASDRLKLEANFDLLIVGDDFIQIWDWKTHGSNKRKSSDDRKKLEESLQTIVYMYVLREQGKLVTGRDIECKSISMHYWQPDPPGTIAYIQYDHSLHKRFGQILEKKIKDILEYDYSAFDKEHYSKHCKYCEFNWFCNNERVDFSAITQEENFMDDMDWDNVEELY